jgi:hypothetical protein
MSRTRATTTFGMACAFFLAEISPLPAAPGAEASEKPMPRVTAISPESGQLGDQLTIRISNLEVWLKANGTPMPVTEEGLSKYILYLNSGRGWVPLPNVCAVRRDSDEGLVFLLNRPKQSGNEADKAREAWASVLGKPDGFSKSMSVSVGYGVQGPLPTAAHLDFKVIPIDRWFWLCIFAFCILLILFWLLAVCSNLIRDPGPEPDGANSQDSLPSNPLKWRGWVKTQWAKTKKPFSLAWTQMAFWTVLIFGAYLFLWIVTQDRDILPGSALVLLGISAGTALGAVMVDTPSNRLQSRGFLTDILSDGNGISFHRFQIVVWTIVLGIVFLASVYNSLSMPSFSETLLALMGISGATYVGFKFQEDPKKPLPTNTEGGAKADDINVKVDNLEVELAPGAQKTVNVTAGKATKVEVEPGGSKVKATLADGKVNIDADGAGNGEKATVKVTGNKGTAEIKVTVK